MKINRIIYLIHTRLLWLGVILVLVLPMSEITAKSKEGENDVITPDQILAQYKIETDNDSLIAAMQHPDALVRQSAIKLIGKHRIEQATPLLHKILHDENSNIRLSAALALRNLGDSTGLSIINELLQSPDSYEQISAAAALCEIGEVGGYDVIKSLLYSKDYIIRILAVGSLNKCKEFPDVIQILSRLVKDQNEAIRLLALEVLFKRRMEETIPIFIEALRDESEAVRFAANKSLEGLTQVKMGFQPFGPIIIREDSVAKWYGWWQMHKGSFVIEERK